MTGGSLLLLCLALFAAGCAVGGAGAPERVAGRWEGAAEFRGARLPLAVNVSEGERGLAANISSPDMFWYEMPLEGVAYNPPRLRLEVPSTPVRLVLDGTVKGDTYTGRSREGELEIPFTLKRTAPAPAPPPYGREEVRFGGGGVELAGTLLVPAGPGPHPAVVFLHGAGPHPRHDYFFYADLFARRGVAALVYDKRGVGDSTGDARSAGQQDLAADALGAVQLLASRGDIDARRIGLWGQSLGGMVAPLAAARSERVAFLILVSPPGVTLGEAEAWDDEFDLRRRGYPEEVIQRSNNLNAQLNQYYRTGEGREAVLAALEQARREGWAEHTDLPEVVPHSRTDSAFGGLDFDLDPAPVLERLKIPVLVIFGERDDRIPAAKSAARINEALSRGGNPDYAVKTFPGADHIIKLPPGQRPDTGGRWDWPRPAPGYLDTMLDWTLRRVNAGRE